MLILGIESSCDETSIAVVEMGRGVRKIHSNRIASQISTHALYGGVVPEIASRAHAECISSLTSLALGDAGVTIENIDAVAVTSTPGLIGSLLVGVNFAKGLAYAQSKPLVGVNHIKGHVAAAYFEYPELEAPFFALIVSGGHTSLTYVKSATEFEGVGRTRDDAAGEAFDKVGRVLGLCYPAGAQMDLLAAKGDKHAIKFAPALIGDTLDFSFSGLKSAVINYVHNSTMRGEEINRADIAASFTEAVVSSVVKNLERAYSKYRFDTLVMAGGVAANSHLRQGVSDFASSHKIKLCVPSVSLCGDNGAMIGAQGYYEFLAGNRATLTLNAKASSGKAAF